MICPECQERGMRSRVYIMQSLTTLVHAVPYYDEDGNYHAYDPNATVCSYECSQGHKFSTQREKA